MKGELFRAWDTETKRMIQGRSCLLLVDIANARVFNTVEDCYQPEGRYILTPYVGMEDRNGKAIFRKDIVGCYDDDGSFMGQHVVEWKEGYFCYALKDCFSDAYEWDLSEWSSLWGNDKALEVLGNVFQNPEWTTWTS